MAEISQAEQRLVMLERAVVALTARVGNLETLAGKAAQDAQLGSNGLGGGDSGSPQLIYTTSTMTARNGNLVGQVSYQIVNPVGNPPTLTATGNSADSGLTVFNVTGGSTTAAGQYGLLMSVQGAKILVVLDCNYTVNPAAPATAATGS